MLTRIQAQLPHLSKSERLVADWILLNPLAALEQDTRQMAQEIQVSQPTLIRFARSMGCEGFQDFRLSLARSLGAAKDAPPTTLLSIAESPDLKSLAGKLFEFTAQALLQVQERLDSALLEHAITALDQASRVDFFGFGNAVSVAQDAMRRFMRMEMQVSACADPHLQALVAGQLRPGDVLMLLSQEGRSPELQRILAVARSRQAITIALTTHRSPLYEAVDIALGIDIPDSGDALTPGTAQIAQLLVMDLLAIGLAARRSAAIADAVPAGARAAPRRKKKASA